MIPDVWWEDDEDVGNLALLPAADAQPLEDETQEQLMRLAYPDYLRSKHWAITRERALLRAGRRCRGCDSASMLQVHHLTYDRLGREAEGDLMVLCDACHGYLHNVSEMEAETLAQWPYRIGIVRKMWPR